MITIAIPVYNVEKYIIRALSSAVNQTYKDIKLLIVDDCGSDNSMELAKEYLSSYNIDVKYIRHNKNLGLGETRNTLIENIDTEYFYFLDSDDELYPNCIDDLIKVASHDDSDIVFGSTKSITSDGSRMLIHGESPRIMISTPHAGWYLKSLAAPHINSEAWGKLFKIKLFNDNNIRCRHRIMEDSWLFLQYCYHSNTVSSVPEFVQIYHRREGSICRNGFDDDESQKILLKVRLDIDNFLAGCKSLPGIQNMKLHFDNAINRKIKWQH